MKEKHHCINTHTHTHTHTHKHIHISLSLSAHLNLRLQDKIGQTRCYTLLKTCYAVHRGFGSDVTERPDGLLPDLREYDKEYAEES